MIDNYSKTERNIWQKYELEKMHQLNSDLAIYIGPVEILMIVFTVSVIGYISYMN